MKNLLKKEIAYEDKKIDFILNKSKKAKNIKIEIKKTGNIFLIAPKLIPNFLAVQFLKTKIDWVLEKQREVLEKRENQKVPELSQKDFLQYKKESLEKIKERVEYFAEKGDFTYGKITIKNNKSNWGSCSSKGNLNFNYRLIFLDPEELDYIIIHELSHLKEMNHSKNFWTEVEKLCPKYKEIRKRIKNIF